AINSLVRVRISIATSSQEVTSYLVVETKYSSLKTFLTKGKQNNRVAKREDFASYILVNSWACVTSVLFATNYMAAGLGVLSAYTVTGTFLPVRVFVVITPLLFK